MLLTFTKVGFWLLILGILIYLLIKAKKQEEYNDIVRNMMAVPNLNTEIELIKEKDEFTYNHYLKAKEEGIAMISDMQMAYAASANLLQKDMYYCRYSTLPDTPMRSELSLWYGAEPVCNMVYYHLLMDLVKNNVIINKEEMNEMLNVPAFEKSVYKTAEEVSDLKG